VFVADAMARCMPEILSQIKYHYIGSEIIFTEFTYVVFDIPILKYKIAK
jgi:hypothetical protein